MVDKDDSLFREIDEELRREQWAKIWDRYGTYVIGAVVALFVLIGGYQIWESRQHARSEAAGAEYTEALRLAAAGKSDEANKKLEDLSTSGIGGYVALAELQRAGALLKANRPIDALTLFEKISKDSSVDQMLRDFSAIQAATLRVGEADFTEMQNRLNALKGPGSAWRHTANELLGLSALKAGKADEARAALGALLGDKETPKGTLERARIMLDSIAAKEIATPQPAAAAPATEPAAAPADANKNEGPGGTSSPAKPK